MLPQGMFSVAVATVLFPALSRLASRRDIAGLRALAGTGMRQIALLLIPSAAAIVALADADRRGSSTSAATFDAELDRPGVDGAVLVLVLAAVRRHQPAADAHVLRAAGAVDADAARALVARRQHRRRRSRSTSRSGSAASVIGTTVANGVMMVLQARACGAALGGLEIARTLRGDGGHARRRGAARRRRLRRLVRRSTACSATR